MNIMFKTTNACNVNCSYCFDKNNQVSSLKDISIMPVERVLECFNKIIKSTNMIDWVWHGGEPLLAGYEWFEQVLYEMRLIEMQKEVNLSFGIQTNGLLLNQDFIDLFDKYNVKISISYDGYNNLLSRGYSRPKYLDIVSSGIIIVNPYNIDHLIDDYKKRNETGYQCFHTNMMFPPPGKTFEQAWGMTEDDIIQKYLKYILFYLYYKDGGISDDSINDWIKVSLGKRANFCSFNNCFETDLICIDYKGDLYKCDSLHKSTFIGNIDDFDEISKAFESPTIKEHIKKKKEIKEKYCKNCIYKESCYQGCWMRSIEESNGERPYSLHCKMTKTIIPVLYEKLNNLTPEDVMELNPVVRSLLLSNLYVPASIKEKYEVKR